MREMLDPLISQMNKEIESFDTRINNSEDMQEVLAAIKTRDADNEDLNANEMKLLEKLKTVGAQTLTPVFS